MARTKITPRKPAAPPTRRKPSKPRKMNPNLDPSKAWINIDVHLDPVTNRIRKDKRWGSAGATFVPSAFDQRLPLKMNSRMPNYAGKIFITRNTRNSQSVCNRFTCKTTRNTRNSQSVCNRFTCKTTRNT